MKTSLKFFSLGFITCFVLWLLFDISLYTFNENDEKARVTIDATNEINGFNFELEDYIEGKKNNFNIKSYTDAYIDYYEEYLRKWNKT